MNKHKVALLLMISSLLLLLVFLVNWVSDVYDREEESLKKEIHYTVSDIITSIEDSLVHKVFIRNSSFEVVGNVKKNERVMMRKTLKADSLTMVVEGEKIVNEPIQSDSTIHMYFQTQSDSIDFGPSHSLLPLLINWEADSMTVALDINQASIHAVDLIMDKYEDVVQESQLPSEFQRVKLSPNESPEGFYVDVYPVPMLGERHGIQVMGYTGYILNRMKSSLLFAFLLFAAISFSFYIIYSNWLNQQRLIEIKNDFISNVTHELKTPISTVSVALEAISNFDVLEDKDKTREYLNISKKELSRLSILVDKVLKMSIFEKGESKLHLEEMEFDHLVNEVLESMKVKFEKEHVHLEKQLIGDDFRVKVDKIHLTNVIYNLLDNAIKYCQENPNIGIKLVESNGAIDFYIKDNGIGIPREDQTKVFNRFYRVPTGDRHNIKGHGLGLSYVASVIKQHEGSINLTSAINVGSTFHIRLKKAYA